jgi:hypothetical protein
MWYKRHYLVPLHGVSTAVLPLLKFQPSYIYIFLLRMTDTMTSLNIDLSSWDILYMHCLVGDVHNNIVFVVDAARFVCVAII